MLSLSNFNLGTAAVLSYEAEIATHESSGVVNMSVVGADAGVVYLAFSVIVKCTKEDYTVQIYLYYLSNTTATSSWSEIIYFTKNIPDFRDGWHKYTFTQWMTPNSNSTIKSASYYFSISFVEYSWVETPYISISVYGSYRHTRLKINLLLVKEPNHAQN